MVYPQGVDDAQIATEVEILSSWELLADVSRAAGLIQQKAGESDAAATAKAVDGLRLCIDDNARRPLGHDRGEL